jgi:hypothetical protein
MELICTALAQVTANKQPTTAVKNCTVYLRCFTLSHSFSLATISKSAFVATMKPIGGTPMKKARSQSFRMGIIALPPLCSRIGTANMVETKKKKTRMRLRRLKAVGRLSINW